MANNYTKVIRELFSYSSIIKNKKSSYSKMKYQYKFGMRLFKYLVTGDINANIMDNGTVLSLMDMMTKSNKSTNNSEYIIRKICNNNDLKIKINSLSTKNYEITIYDKYNKDIVTIYGRETNLKEDIFEIKFYLDHLGAYATIDSKNYMDYKDEFITLYSFLYLSAITERFNIGFKTRALITMKCKKIINKNIMYLTGLYDL